MYALTGVYNLDTVVRQSHPNTMLAILLDSYEDNLT